jgi:hypothetical protein
MPSLIDMMEKEKEQRKKLGDANQGLGLSQAFHLGEISNYECVFPALSFMTDFLPPFQGVQRL